MNRTLAVAALALGGMAACGRAKAPAVRGDSAVTSAAAASPAAAGGPQCPRTGHWGECQVRIRLEQSGLAPLPTTQKVGELPALAGAPVLYLVGNAGVAVYLYPDSVSRRRAGESLDTTKFIPPSRAVGMHGEATAIQNDNALVLLFTRNEHQRERVSDAITAGPPQP